LALAPKLDVSPSARLWLQPSALPTAI